MPAPLKAKSGGWILKLNHTTTPVIGELMIRGVYTDKDVTPPIIYNVFGILNIYYFSLKNTYRLQLKLI